MERVKWLRGIVIVLFAAFVCSACIIRPGPGGDTQNANDANNGGGAAIVVQNNSGGNICKVRFSPTSDTSYGPDRLGSSEQIGPGESRSFGVTAGAYDVVFQDCSDQTLAEHRNIAVNGPTTVSFP